MSFTLGTVPLNDMPTWWVVGQSSPLGSLIRDQNSKPLRVIRILYSKVPSLVNFPVSLISSLSVDGSGGESKLLIPLPLLLGRSGLVLSVYLVPKPTDIRRIPNGPAGTPSSTASCLTKILNPLPEAGTPTA